MPLAKTLQSFVKPFCTSADTGDCFLVHLQKAALYLPSSRCRRFELFLPQALQIRLKSSGQLLSENPCDELLRPIKGKCRTRRLDKRFRKSIAKAARTKDGQELFKTIAGGAYGQVSFKSAARCDVNMDVNHYLMQTNRDWSHLETPSGPVCPDLWLAFDAATVGQEDTLFGVRAVSDSQAVWLAPQAPAL